MAMIPMTAGGGILGLVPPAPQQPRSFFDQNQNAIMGLASALLEGSGWSPVPQSLGSGLGRGLRAYQQGALMDQQLNKQKAEEDQWASLAKQMGLDGIPSAAVPGLVTKMLESQFAPKDQFSPLSDEEEAAMGLPTEGVYQRNSAGQVSPVYKPEGAGFEKIDLGDRVEVRDRSGKLIETIKKGSAPSEGPKPSDVAGMRKEFTGLTKDFQVVQDSYNRIQEVTKKPSAAGDLALLYNYVKLLDPGSVVRESEFALAATAGSYGERIKAEASRIMAGERLSDAMRADYKGRADDLFTAQKNSYNQIKKQYRTIAERSGLNPDDVTVDFETPQQERPLPAGGGQIQFLGFENP